MSVVPREIGDLTEEEWWRFQFWFELREAYRRMCRGLPDGYTAPGIDDAIGPVLRAAAGYLREALAYIRDPHWLSWAEEQALARAEVKARETEYPTRHIWLAARDYKPGRRGRGPEQGWAVGSVRLAVASALVHQFSFRHSHADLVAALAEAASQIPIEGDRCSEEEKATTWRLLAETPGLLRRLDRTSDLGAVVERAAAIARKTHGKTMLARPGESSLQQARTELARAIQSPLPKSRYKFTGKMVAVARSELQRFLPRPPFDFDAPPPDLEDVADLPAYAALAVTRHPPRRSSSSLSR